jgi:ribosomal protein S18 acetylase RimI-like enzyme
MPIDHLPLTASDQSFIWEMLYQAIYVPAGTEPPAKYILEEPEIALYAAGWGRDGDMGLKALDNGTPVGAAWLRLMQGYGHVADDIPELTIAVLPTFRGQGIGTELLKGLIDLASRRYRGISLSVIGENPAMRFYEKLGFEIVRLEGESYTMLWSYKK